MRHLHRKRELSCIAIVFGMATLSPLALADKTGSDAHAVLASATDAMGGEKLLRSLTSLKFDIRETQFRVDDSERAESPFWISSLTLAETRDLQGGRYHDETSVDNPQFSYTQTTTSDGAISATALSFRGQTAYRTRPETHERMELSPERILLTAAAASDLHELPDVSVHGVLHHDLRFTWRGFQVDVFVNADTHLPDRIASLRTNPYDIAQHAWGDIRWSTDFLFWKREADGLVYPRQWDTSRNGSPIFTESVVKLAEGVPLDAASFTVPEAAQKQFADTEHLPVDDYPFDGSKQMVALGKDVWLLAGNWNVLVVQQADGLVVIDCPQSTGYSAKVLDFLQQKFPGVKVKAVVSTTDSTWHYAGLRTYLARGIPAYALDLNVPLLQSFLSAPHTLTPDEYAGATHSPDLRAISDRTVIGDGDARMELYPIRGESDERMMMVYFPGLELLYGSSNDLSGSAQAGWRGTFNLPEVVDAARARHLAVTTYVGIHTAATPWQTVVDTALPASATH